MERATVLDKIMARDGITAGDIQGALNAGDAAGKADKHGARWLWANADGEYDSWARYVGWERAPADDCARGRAIMDAFRAGYVMAAIKAQAEAEHQAILASIPDPTRRTSGSSATEVHPESEALADRPRADY
jgi:hypothetical protein